MVQPSNECFWSVTGNGFIAVLASSVGRAAGQRVQLTG